MSINEGVVLKYTSKQQSVDGNFLSLEIIRHGISNLCFEFTVKKISVHFTEKEILFNVIVILSLLTAVNLEDPNFYVLCLVFILIGRLISKLLWNVKSESVLIVAPVGLQLTASYQCGIQCSQLIPWHCISDVIINEAITSQKVVYYLAVLVKDPLCADSSKKLIPLFQVNQHEVWYKGAVHHCPCGPCHPPNEGLLWSQINLSFRLDVREEVEIVEVVKTIIEKPSSVPHKINTRSLNVCIKNEFWSRHSKMFALLQLKEKFEHFQLFPKVFILSISIKEMDSDLDRTTMTSDISHDIGYSEIRHGEDILCNLHPCNTMTASPKSHAMRRSLSTDSLSILDPPKPQDTLSVLATPPKKVSAEDILESVLTNTSNDSHENCVRDKENNRALSPRLLQRKRKYSYGTGWQPPLKRIALGSDDLCAQEMKFTITEKKSKSFTSLLTPREFRQRIHYFSDQTQYSYMCKQDNIFRDRTSILALINKYERDVNRKSGINFVKNNDKSENDLWVSKTTNVSLDRNEIVDCNSSTNGTIFASYTDKNFYNSYGIDDIFAHCTYKNVRMLQDTLRNSNNITSLNENVSVEHCENINDVSCTSNKVFEDEECTKFTITTESEHSDHNVNEELTINVNPSSGESEQIQVEKKGCIVSAAGEMSIENDRNISEEIACSEDVCSNIEAITDASDDYQLDKDDTLVDVRNSCTEEEPSSGQDKMRNNHVANYEVTHIVEPENEVLNSDLNQELCINSISNTCDSNSCLTSSEAIEIKNTKHFAEDSCKLLVNAFETGCERELMNTNINYTDKKNMSTHLVPSAYNANAQRHDRRPRHCTGISPLKTVIKEVVYPRPLDYAHVLTRRQFENEVKLFEDKVLLTVDELLSSNNMLKPELRTRSMKGRTVNLKKLLQDLRSNPTVVLYRIDDQYRKHLKK